jgi:hypothetical protein
MSDRNPASAGRGFGRGRGLRSPTASEGALSDTPMENVTVSESIIVQRHTATAPGNVEAQTRQQVEVLAATQQLTYDQLKQFWDKHQALRRDTSEAFGQASDAL